MSRKILVLILAIRITEGKQTILMDPIEIATKDAKQIYSFWSSLSDEENGGFYGRMDFDLKVHKKAQKGVILNSRILYFFSQYAMVMKEDGALQEAKNAYEFLKKAVDRTYGGVYWSLDYKGRPLSRNKHTYNLAFAIYALSYYYKATKDEEAIELAYSLYQTIEDKCRDKDGPRYYKEEQKEDFTYKDNIELSENGVLATRTMNTALHVLEAYTGLYMAKPSKEVGNSLQSILDLFLGKIYDPEKKRLGVFFDKDYNSILNLESYGHEIETSWLLLEAADALQDEKLTARILPVSMDLAESVRIKAYDEPFIINEKVKKHLDQTRVWWVQAEAVNGYLNCYQRTGNKDYYDLAITILTGIQDYFLDYRPNSEWFWDLDDWNKPSSRKDIVEPWKCPYHNGRMCFEILTRLNK